MATLPKSARLRRTPEFRNTFDRGRKMVCGPLVLYAAIRNPSTQESSVTSLSPSTLRLGLVVSRKVGNAVTRNRVKRAIREAFRNLRLDLAKSEPWSQVDLIVLARPSAASTTGKDLALCLKSCLNRLRKNMGVRQGKDPGGQEEPANA